MMRLCIDERPDEGVGGLVWFEPAHGSNDAKMLRVVIEQEVPDFSDPEIENAFKWVPVEIIGYSNVSDKVTNC